MLDAHFWMALSSSFWIIPREGTEALLVVLMLCTALKQSQRSEQLPIIYRCCGLALLAGAALVVGCIYMQHIFTGQNRELSEAFASLIALSMLLYVNFNVFQGYKGLRDMSLLALGFMAFISVFRELAETVLFYIALFHGGITQQLGTLAGVFAGICVLLALMYMYHTATDRWKQFNRIIFSATPFFMFFLALMCIGNAIGALQEAGYLGFHPVSWMFNSELLHAQASREYVLAVGIFLCSTGLLFLRQFTRAISQLISYLLSLTSKQALAQEAITCPPRSAQQAQL